MKIEERYKYLRMMQKRYREAGRGEKGKLITEMEMITGMHRKSLIRSMNGILVRKGREKQRGCKYDFEVIQAVKVISQSMDYPCAERLQPNLGWMANQLKSLGKLQVTDQTLQLLDEISIATVQRRLKNMKIETKLPRRRAEEANRWRRQVPAKRIPWNEQEPGHFEVDLVHHSGSSASGLYVHTLQMVDVATGWSERAAVFGRSYLTMEDGFSRILARLPFRVKEIHPDNGSEFLNDHIMTFWYGQSHRLEISRSRPWQKNDNRFVEQKNDTLVRGYIGYQRLDTVEQTNLLNYLYDLMGIYYNFFQPVMRLKEKVITTTSDKPFRVRRRFDRACPPLDRLCDTKFVDEDVKSDLLNMRKQIDPLLLRDEIYTSIHLLLSSPTVNDNSIQDVHQTLGLWKHKHQFPDNQASDLFNQLILTIYSNRKERVLQ